MGISSPIVGWEGLGEEKRGRNDMVLRFEEV